MTSIRAARADLATLVRRAAAGEATVIEVRGRPAARLGPIAGTDRVAPSYDALVANGALVPERRHDRTVPLGEVGTWATVRLDRVLRDIRG